MPTNDLRDTAMSQLSEYINNLKRTSAVNDSIYNARVSGLKNFSANPGAFDAQDRVPLAAYATAMNIADPSTFGKYVPPMKDEWLSSLGILDGLLFGAIPNKSYTREGTENSAAAARLTGDVLGALVPWGAMFKGASKLPAIARILGTGYKEYRWLGKAGAAVQAGDKLKDAKDALRAAKIAKDTARIAKEREALHLASKAYADVMGPKRFLAAAGEGLKAGRVLGTANLAARLVRGGQNITKNKGVSIAPSKPSWEKIEILRQYMDEHRNDPDFKNYLQGYDTGFPPLNQ